MKRVFVAHGWDGTPEEGWFPWLKRELEAKGFSVIVPQLPETGSPRIYNWVPALTEAVGVADGNTYFVGHSMGCQAIARYLESLPEGVTVGGAVFVAGFFKRLTGLEDDPDVQATDKHWLESPIDFVKIRSHLSRSVAIFSDDDPWVPLDNQDDFRDKLGSEIVVEHAKGHFSGNRDKTTELPLVLESVLKMAKA
jgi:predicted alpha/beta hydrolase family esterase